MTDLAIRVEHLSKQYQLGAYQSAGYRTIRESLMQVFRGGRSGRQLNILQALDDVSFDVAPGEVIGIVGRNGAGKSTLLKVLSRITEPSSGFAEVNGRIGSLLEVGSGFHPELSGRENIFLNGAILGMHRSEILAKFDEIVAFAEVERFVDTPVKRYSSGMYLRLAFGVAAHLEPEILVIDEVLAVGDAAFQSKCLAKMQDVSGTGRTVLFVSHNLGAVQRLCPRSLLLEAGRIVMDGPTHKVIQAYMSRGLLQRPEYSATEDRSKPIHLRRASLTDASGVLANEFRYDEPVRISIEYDVNEPIVGCSVWVGIRTAEETWAFGSADSDVAGVDLQVPRTLGRHRTTLDIPGRWLNAGRYHAVIGIARLSAHQSYDRIDLASFDILDVGIPEPGRPGVFQPTIAWREEVLGASKTIGEEV